MRQIDLTPYRRSTIGFDRLFDMLESSTRQISGDNYPPFNLERLGEDRYRITLAVAGFKPDEIDVTAQQNLLVVTGKRREEEGANSAAYLHLGIANRSFERRFELADFIRAEGANLTDGLLTIELVREVPEAMKPRSIAVNSGPAPRAVEHQAANAA